MRVLHLARGVPAPGARDGGQGDAALASGQTQAPPLRYARLDAPMRVRSKRLVLALDNKRLLLIDISDANSRVNWE